VNTDIVPFEGTNEPDVQPDGQAATIAYEALVTQGRLAPGERGWWQVWGACVRDIEPGDLVMCKDRDDPVIHIMLITGTFEANCNGIRMGFISADKQITLGVGCPIILLRGGTRNTLARSVR
jgi:hypothetical protein